MVVVLFATPTLDGELMGLVLRVGKGHQTCFEEGDNGCVVVKHGERSLFAGDGYRYCFSTIEAGCWSDDFDGHGRECF